MEKQTILSLEEKMLRAFDFSLRKVSSIDFLGRFFRLFGLSSSQIKRDHSRLVIYLAVRFCMFMQRESLFLRFRPSQLAAASLLFSINFIHSKVVKSTIEMEPLPKEALEVFIIEEIGVHKEMPGAAK